MNTEHLLAATKDLIAIPSTADNPDGLKAAYEYIRQMIWDSGKAIAIEEFESNGKLSLLAYREGPRPDNFHVILNGHVDVIPGKPEQYEPHITDEKLYGRGAYDMKAAAIILTNLFCEFVDKVPYPLALQIVTDEEPGGYNGVYYQIEQGVRADFTICGECGRHPDDYEIANEAKGIVFADIELKGKTSHGAYPWRSDNAAMHAVRFAQRLHDIYPTPDAEWHDTTVTVTAISSEAETHNKVPELAIVKLDCRFIVKDPHFQSEQAFADFIKSVDPRATIAALPVFSSPMRADPQDTLMQALKTAAEAVEGHAFSFVRRHAGSDGRHYLPVGGQACEFGIAGEHQHADGEYITLQAFHNYLATMRRFLLGTMEQGPEDAEPQSLSVDTATPV